MAFTYRVIDGGIVQILEGGTWVTPMPTQADIGLFHKSVERWAPLALDAEATYGVPASYTLATILGESGGNERSGPSFDGGVGLMALTTIKEGHTNDELKDPALNIDIGVRRHIVPAMQKVGDDVPKLASMFNAGWNPKTGQPWPNARAPWGYNEWELRDKDGNRIGVWPYITRVVKMNNYIRAWLAENTELSKRDSGGFVAVIKKATPLLVLGMIFGAGAAYYGSK